MTSGDGGFATIVDQQYVEVENVTRHISGASLSPSVTLVGFPVPPGRVCWAMLGGTRLAGEHAPTRLLGTVFTAPGLNASENTF
ncbi:hypothetical protein [Mycolicibacterium frederiksbergense]|uniref:hypothetical protein n=1 Tax=Mycolicibacterium frederiksbergense TaxID=117567 RepID=UPI00265C6741|nr:hypothetical protein [Mycolicibacterium frederiksbergense]MDO0976947.1 hypothetical protein [Mycolicibacterium frederiksbergense]